MLNRIHCLSLSKNKDYQSCMQIGLKLRDEKGKQVNRKREGRLLGNFVRFGDIKYLDESQHFHFLQSRGKIKILLLGVESKFFSLSQIFVKLNLKT